MIQTLVRTSCSWSIDGNRNCSWSHQCIMWHFPHCMRLTTDSTSVFFPFQQSLSQIYRSKIKLEPTWVFPCFSLSLFSGFRWESTSSAHRRTPRCSMWSDHQQYRLQEHPHWSISTIWLTQSYRSEHQWPRAASGRYSENIQKAT